MEIPLENFQAIYAMTLELLLWLKDEPGSTFIMTSASPVFGIERSAADRSRWGNALRRRIAALDQEVQPETVLLCLNPDSTNGLTDSPLWAFCCELETSGLLKAAEAHSAAELFLRSMSAFSEFANLAQHKGFELRCGPTSPLHFVLARTAGGESRGILYFTGIKSKTSALTVSGFATGDGRWIRLINAVYEFVKSQSRDVLSTFQEDHRTDAQKARSLQLLTYQLQRRRPYDVSVGDYSVVVFPGVFPPEMGFGTIHLLTALKRIGEIVCEAFPDRTLVGIDVGTGTGVLSLALAQYCSEVYATDISSTASRNAEENAKRAVENTVSGRQPDIRVFCGNLLDPVPPIDREALWIIVFNYPFYPTPLAVDNPAGRLTAGTTVIRDFFAQVSRIAPNDAVLILPCCNIAGDHNAFTVGRDEGFAVHTLLETTEGDSVHAFTKNSALLSALRDLASAEPDTRSHETSQAANHPSCHPGKHSALP